MRNLRTPEGLNSSGDAYSARFGEILSHIQRLHRIVDDTLIHDYSIEDAFYHAYELLKMCAPHLYPI